MKKQPFLRNSCGGFTLLEVILTLLLISFAGLMLMELTGTALTKSAIPIQWTREEFILKERVEQLTANYTYWVNNHNNDISVPTDFTDFKTNYVDANPYKFYMTSQFIDFACSGTICDEHSPPSDTNNLKVIVASGDMEAVVIFSNLKKPGDALYINY